MYIDSKAPMKDEGGFYVLYDEAAETAAAAEAAAATKDDDKRKGLGARNVNNVEWR